MITIQKSYLCLCLKTINFIEKEMHMNYSEYGARFLLVGITDTGQEYLLATIGKNAKTKRENIPALADMIAKTRGITVKIVEQSDPPPSEFAYTEKIQIIDNIISGLDDAFTKIQEPEAITKTSPDMRD